SCQTRSTKRAVRPPSDTASPPATARPPSQEPEPAENVIHVPHAVRRIEARVDLRVRQPLPHFPPHANALREGHPLALGPPVLRPGRHRFLLHDGVAVPLQNLRRHGRRLQPQPCAHHLLHPRVDGRVRPHRPGNFADPHVFHRPLPAFAVPLDFL